MVTAHFSQKFEAVRSRIKRLPRLYEEMLVAIQKGDAERLTELFRDGILNRKLRLTPLQPETIKRKTQQGLPSPTTPLYGMGPDEEESYANMMEVVEERVGKGKRWIVRPRQEQHHSSELDLADLFIVHEFGTTITNGFGRGILIRIPPRPAMRYAFRKLMKERKNRDDNARVQEAITRFVRDGDRAAYRRVKERK